MRNTQERRQNVLPEATDDVSYGSKPKDAKHWREKLLREVGIDPNRVHFLGKIPYDRYRSLLQASAAHVYLTYPFVLSWSMLEAMACGCLVIGSDTAPVREVIQDGVNGVLVDFFDAGAIAQVVSDNLVMQNRQYSLRKQAVVEMTKNYNLISGISAYQEILQ